MLKAIMASVIPVVILILNWTVYLSVYAIRRSKKTLYSGYQSSLMLLYSIHPYIVKAGVALISCKAVEDSTLWLTADVSLKCWQAYHFNYVTRLFLPMFILFILGIPMTILISISRLRRSKWRDLVTFFTAGYRTSSGLWEVVICLRKTFLILVLGLLGSSESVVQILSAMIVLYLFLEWQVREGPFMRDFHNKLEAFGLFLQLILTGFSFYFIPSLHIRDVILVIISYSILLIVLGFILTSIGILVAQIVLYRRRKGVVQPTLPRSEVASPVIVPPPPSNNSSMLPLAPKTDEANQSNLYKQ